MIVDDRYSTSHLIHQILSERSQNSLLQVGLYFVDQINKVANAPVGGPYNLVGWKMKESDYKENITKYINMLDQTQRESFASID